MSLSAALAANKATTKGPKCSVCTLIADLPTDDATALLAAFDDPSFTSAAITRALKAEGHDLSTCTILRHRKRECRG
jgi:hypothetical protein